MNIQHKKLGFVKSFSVISLALSFALGTACSKNTEHENHEHEEHESHEHEGHEHEDECHEHEHEDHEHEEHEGHKHEHEGHEHECHEGHEHEGHVHATGKKQVIPAGYTVNYAVSNHPLFLLSEAVTKGTQTTVKKLLNAGDVGHHGSLSPSDLKEIKNSKYVVWFGNQLESNLVNQLGSAKNTVKILDNKQLTTYQRRNEHAEVIDGTLDPHIWLDPKNAKIIVNELAKLHSEANPKLAATYKKNAENFAKELDQLVLEQKSKRSDEKKYWSSHDAFQYIEDAMNLELAGTLTTDHEIPAKASQILWLTKHRPNKTMCLLTQSSAKAGIVNKLQPINTEVLIEDMSDNETYLAGWKAESDKIINCVK